MKMKTGFNLDFLQEITNGNHEKMCMLIQSFISEAPAAMTKLNKIVQQKNFSSVKEETHSMKPLFQSIGADDALKTIERIEKYSSSPMFHELLSVETEQLKTITHTLCEKLGEKLTR